jgi:hypothetical protein
LQGAKALLSATLGFLRRNDIPRKLVVESISESFGPKRSRANQSQYRRLVRHYEEMGMVMATWFSLPRFLDRESRPLPLTLRRGRLSVKALVKASRVTILPATAIALMRRSLSVRFDASGNVVALRPEFVLPNFEVPRAALVIERYLDTLIRNSSPRRGKTILLLERNCHVPQINLRTIKPILRDIKGRGAAFIRAVDGDIEGRRARRTSRNVGEMSVHIFAWTKSTRRVRRNGTGPGRKAAR